MSAAYLIDGYNLMHAMGLVLGKVSPAALDRARQRLLGFVSAGHGPEAGAVTVVFDASSLPPGVDKEQVVAGVRVRYAVDHADADDLIESLIRRDSDPRHLHVVSDDHRVQRAGRRRHCRVLGCEEYLRKLEEAGRRRQRQAPEAPEKAGAVGAEETERWLREFGAVEDDPAFKELSEYYDFADEGEPEA